MSGGVITFGSYTFPTTLAEFEDNFADAVPQSQRLPGLDGGWNEDGDGRANTAVGRVTVGFWLVAQSRSDMDDQRDTVARMLESGLAKLTYQPTDPADPPRFCWARVNYIRMGERKDAHTDLHQKVQVIFQAPDPHWLIGTATPWALGDGSTIGQGGLTIGGGGTPTIINASGTLTSATISHAGNAETIATVSIQTGAGQTCQNPTLQRILNGHVVDEIAYTGTLGANQELTISGRAQVVMLNGVSAFGPNFSYAHPDFLRLTPGDNAIQVRFQNGGDAATVKVWFYTTYR